MSSQDTFSPKFLTIGRGQESGEARGGRRRKQNHRGVAAPAPESLSHRSRSREVTRGRARENLGSETILRQGL